MRRYTRLSQLFAITPFHMVFGCIQMLIGSHVHFYIDNYYVLNKTTQQNCNTFHSLIHIIE